VVYCYKQYGGFERKLNCPALPERALLVTQNTHYCNIKMMPRKQSAIVKEIQAFAIVLEEMVSISRCLLVIDTRDIINSRVAETVMENDGEPWRAAVGLHQVCDRKVRRLCNTPSQDNFQRTNSTVPQIVKTRQPHHVCQLEI